MVTMARQEKRPEPLDLVCNATPTVAGQVRLMLQCRFAEWGLAAPKYAEVQSDLFLIAAELVTNATTETPDRKIEVSCVPDVNARLIRFSVWDSSDRKPGAAMPELDLETLDLSPEHYDDNGGWGLPLVQALSESCGVTPTNPGKWVWAIVKVKT
jgi:anti-sigma regulatory factor (Ser/Thr protein kinase)